MYQIKILKERKCMITIIQVYSMSKVNEREITWLQLSDLHIFESTDWNIMKQNYEELARRIHVDFIVVTGDFRHKKFEETMNFSYALNFLNFIKNCFGLKKEDIFLIPGNHDVNDYDYRLEGIETIIKEVEKNPDIYLNYMGKTPGLMHGFSEYLDFVRNFYADSVKDERIQNPAGVINIVWKNKINLILLNTALISSKIKQQTEIIDLRELSKIKNDSRLPTLVLGHHDIDSIAKSQRDRIISIFEKLQVKAYLCGDAHKTGIKYIDKYYLTEAIPCIVCGKSTVEMTDQFSDVGIILYRWKDNGKVYVEPYKWEYESGFRKSDQFLYDIDKEFNFDFRENKESRITKRNNEKLNLKNPERENNDLMIKPSNVYEDITEAHRDIANDIRQGGFLDFYGLRGATFIGTPEVNSIVKELKSNQSISTKFLISYPFSEEVRERLMSIPEYRDNDKCEAKWRDTYDKIKSLQNDYKEYKNAKVRFHDTPLIFRFLITGEHIYLGYYEPEKNSVNTPIYKYENDTPIYRTYKSFFDKQWIKAKRSIPNIPPEYSFLQEKFPVKPSLVINTTSGCNLNCQYCPEGGESLCKIEQKDCIDVNVIKKLLISFRKHVLAGGDKPILRITGGEPLLNEENRCRVISILKEAKDYKKIVLCTNGVFWNEAYNLDKELWNDIKKNLLLKISLDTLDCHRFLKISNIRNCQEGKKIFDRIIENIKNAKSKGFRIELNMVATTINVVNSSDVIDMFEFAKDNGLVGLKVLTVNSFGGSVSFEQGKRDKKHITTVLSDVINIMRKKEYEERDVYLNDNKGIKMKRFIATSSRDKQCTLTIVDHHSDLDSITPRRTFSEFCKTCKYYANSQTIVSGERIPCATGIMSLTLRADGILSPCRLCEEKCIDIRRVSKQDKMDSIVNDILNAFDKCFHMSIEESSGGMSKDI